MRAGPADHPNTAIARRVLAGLLEIVGDSYTANQLEEQGLQVLRKQPRTGNAAEASRLVQAGDSAFESHNYFRAGSLYETALADYEAIHGPDHATVAELWEKMSRVVTKLGREKEASVCARRAERIRAALADKPK